MEEGASARQGTLWTIGHSTRPWDAFVELLREGDITQLVDVRRFAGSRRNPQFSPDLMGPALGDAGIEYIPMPELGGRRPPARPVVVGAARQALATALATTVAMSAS